jgi:hypothetical protein
MSRVRPRTAFVTIGQLIWNEYAALSANFHSFKSLVKPWNQAAKTLGERDWLRISHLGFAVVTQHRLAVLVSDRRSGVVGGRVEFLSVVGAPVGAKIASVVNLVHLVGLGIGARTDPDVLPALGEGSLHDALDRRYPEG